MKQVLTLVVKLQVDVNQQQLLSDTANAFASGCNWINQNVNPHLTNRNSIQAFCYKDVKNRFGLTANHVVRACARVAANRLTARHKGRKVKYIKPTSFDCDARTFRFMEKNWTVSLSSIGKRLTAPIRASNYHRVKLKGQKPTSAQVCLHRDGNWYVHTFISIEDLTGIRQRTNHQPRNKTERRRSNSWAFYQLRAFLEYKSIKEGVEVLAINPAYTSQTCHCCLQLGLRSNKSFKCANTARCGWIGDADDNASKMIALVGLSVNQAGGSQLLACEVASLEKNPKACDDRPVTEGLLKASCL